MLVATAAPEGLVAINGEARITFVNDAATTLLGRSRAELMGSTIWEAVDVRDRSGQRLPREERPSFRALSEGCLAQGRVFVERADGTSLPVRYVAAPARREGGLVGAIVAFEPEPDADESTLERVARVTAEHARLRRELARLSADLDARDRELDELGRSF